MNWACHGSLVDRSRLAIYVRSLLEGIGGGIEQIDEPEQLIEHVASATSSANVQSEIAE